MRISASFITLALASLILASCGGGGSDDSGGSGSNPSPTPVVSASPSPDPSPSASPEPTNAPTPSPGASPSPSPTPITGPVDQCDTTEQCRTLFGDSATDCADSQSDQSICMCGSSPCDDDNGGGGNGGDGVCSISGDLKQWHRVTLSCEGYAGDEQDDATFTDHRLQVTFTQGDRSYSVPGHFAADGNAADSSATLGDHWRAYFLPPSTGTWQYSVSFRKGDDIAVSTSNTAGTAVEEFDGKIGSFNVTESDASGRDMRARGLLQHKQGERYLRFAGNNQVFIEGGMDSPENIFGFHEFDNTTKFNNVSSCKGILHEFASHTDDWQNGDPQWKNGLGKALVGLVNYISGKGVNAVYVMANTVNGDGCDAHPWRQYNGNRRAFDVSKLDQWERVFSHISAKGLMIHVMTQETENDQLLNNGNLGLERKLYYRELVSRFGHHPALQWNLGEENTNTAQQQRDFSDFIKAQDPYDHPIMMHTYPNEQDKYDELLGHPSFDGPTLQYGRIPTEPFATSGVYGKTLDWIQRSRDAGNTWVVSVTEASGADAPTPNTAVSSRQRVYWMWANVMAGGGGFEWYLKNEGSGHAYDLAVEDLREFDQHWEQSGHLVSFFRDTLQGELGIELHSMQPDNAVTSTNSDWVLADPGKAYLIFLREGGSTDIDLPNNSSYRVLWFNPRSGEQSQGANLSGPGMQNIGNPPAQSNQDWVAVVTADDNGSALHPDIVRVANIPLEDIVQTPRNGWKDSYSVGDNCYCDSTVDHNIGDISVNTPAGTMTVREACDLIGPGPGAAGRPIYNDIQCGNGPANDAGDEDYCPGRVDIGKEGCRHIGPVWKFPATGAYTQRDGLVIMEAENTASDLGLWQSLTSIENHTGAGYLEFTGNSPLNGPARSPLEYRFTVNQGGLHYLHLLVAKEHLTLNGELRTDVANDAYVRLEGDFGAGPNVGNNHNDDAPLEALRSDTKFFGGNDRSFAWASGARLDLGGERNKRVAVYDFKAGETYTLTMSGRSQFFKVDRIVFRHSSVSASSAQDRSKSETR